ncbi:MAG: hypothetical protein K0V04_21820 [Deltaproteobacteria bacterium]|nr:hypothetical protein [Deltaproteobacteria bacterium]
MRRVSTACLAMAAANLVWAVVAGLGASQWLWTEVIGGSTSPIWSLTESIQAGTVVGQWLMLAAAAPLLRRSSVAVLLALDGLAQLALVTRADAGGTPWLAAPVLLLLVVVALDRSGPAKPPTVGPPWLALACVWFLGTGLVVMFGLHSPPFAIYREALMGLDPSPQWPLVELAYGRIAVGFMGHYAVLLLALRRCGPSPALLRAALAAQLGWVVVDSTGCLMHGGAFNLLMINVPATLLFGIAWWATWRGRERVVPAPVRP